MRLSFFSVHREVTKTIKTVCALFILMVSGTGPACGNHILIPKAEEFTLIKRSSKEFRAIRAIFDNLAEEAKMGNVEGVLANYSNHLEPERSINDLKDDWRLLFSLYENVEILLPIHNIEVYGNLARVRVERIIRGRPRSRPSDKGYVLINSLNLMVYNLVKENGVWKIIGGELPYNGASTPFI